MPWRRDRSFAHEQSGPIQRECPDHAPVCGILSDDLYIEPELWPRIGCPPKHDVEAWTGHGRLARPCADRRR
jgi:hypothetical protein